MLKYYEIINTMLVGDHLLYMIYLQTDKSCDYVVLKTIKSSLQIFVT